MDKAYYDNETLPSNDEMALMFCDTFWDSEGYDWSHFIGYRWDLIQPIDNGEIVLFFVDSTRGVYRRVSN